MCRNEKPICKQIFQGLKPGGWLILTEKVLMSTQTDELYKKFKVAQGVGREYIEYKEESLKEVLISYPLDWYLVKLREIGFTAPEIINANRGFVTFSARR